MKSLAGRNAAQIIAEVTRGIDARFWSGNHDLCELPSACKDTDSVSGRHEEVRFGRGSGQAVAKGVDHGRGLTEGCSVAKEEKKKEIVL